jgi:hypothetical protein
VTFVAGLVAGITITALGALFVFQARVIEGKGRDRMPDLRNLIAVAALIIAIVALVRSGDHHATAKTDATVPTTEPSTSAGPTTASSSPGSSAPGSSSSTTSTTSTTLLRQVTVPNVVGLAQTTAIAALQRAGLRSRVQSLALGNVPAGFVVTQTPIAYSTTTSGAIVVLGVSAGA